MVPEHGSCKQGGRITHQTKKNTHRTQRKKNTTRTVDLERDPTTSGHARCQAISILRSVKFKGSSVLTRGRTGSIQPVKEPGKLPTSLVNDNDATWLILVWVVGLAAQAASAHGSQGRW